MQHVCRLCSHTDHLVDVSTEFLRELFFTTSAVMIKEDDVVSKRVCRRCCQIAVLLHKYRAKVIENDKLLKERRSEKVKQHPSISTLMRENKGIVIPKQIVSQDLLPVVTLDENEVKDWYEQTYIQIKKKLSNITVKRVSCDKTNHNVPPADCFKLPIDEVFSLAEQVKTEEGIFVMSTPPLERVKINLAHGILTSTLVPVEPSSENNSELNITESSDLSNKINIPSEADVPQNKQFINSDDVKKLIKKKRNEIGHPPESKYKGNKYELDKRKRTSSTNSDDTSLIDNLMNSFSTSISNNTDNSEIMSISDILQKNPIGIDDKLLLITPITKLLCEVCSVECDTETLLTEHQKRHSKPKFCEKTSRQISENDLNQYCNIKVKEEPPDVDSMLAIHETSQNSQCHSFSNGVNANKSYQETDEIVCISDDSDTESTSLNVQESAVDSMDFTEINSTEFGDFCLLSKQFENEQKLMDNLFSKNFKIDESQNDTPSFKPISEYTVKRVNTNTFLLVDFLLNFGRYLVPLEFVIHPSMFIKYNNEPLPKEPHAREQWNPKISTDINLDKLKDKVRKALIAANPSLQNH
ncbi:hypothetical protein FQA39_LY15582 [Lamprigera yunnana]|nr:hypothetical protein FQA39_LY15582 [Lamprigera yunnana]